MWRGRIIATTLLVLAALSPLTVFPVHASGPVRIVVVGDSLSAGYGLAAADAFPARLEAALRESGHDARVENAGVSGDTTAGGRARLAWAIGDDPEAVILELGANDALRGLHPEKAYDNLAAMLTRLQEKNIPVLLAGMKAPPNMGEDYAQEFDAVFRRLAAAYDVIFYPFFLKGVAGQPALNQEDGIHPTAEGVGVIVENILPSVEALLERATAIKGRS